MAASTEGMKATACNLCNVNCGVMVKLGGEDGRQFLKILGDENSSHVQGLHLQQSHPHQPLPEQQ